MSNEILDNVEYVLEGGALIHRGNRLLLLTPEALVDVQKALERELAAETVSQAIYEAARRMGADWAVPYLTDEPTDPDKLVRTVAHLCSQLGWGRIEVIEAALGRGVLEFEVYHSAFAEAYHKSGVPVCHWIRGFYAGVWQAMLSRPVNGLETSCRTVEGVNPCRFIFVAAEADQLTAQVTEDS